MFRIVVDNSLLNELENKDSQTHSHVESDVRSSLNIVFGSQHFQQIEQLKFEAALDRVISRAQKLDW